MDSQERAKGTRGRKSAIRYDCEKRGDPALYSLLSTGLISRNSLAMHLFTAMETGKWNKNGKVMDKYQVKDKWAFITGASRGIGYLTARFMAQQGCNLVLHSRKLEHTEKIIQEVQNLGVKAHAVEAELDNLAEVERMLHEIDDLELGIDIVLNNAGLQIAYRTDYLRTPKEDYEISFRVNTIAPAMICYHFLPDMIRRGTGRILNTTSGISLDVCQAGYSASKAALDKITIDRGSKVEGTDVMINLTDPGWCRTDLGGPQAPNDPCSAIPGIVVGVFVDDQKSGRYLNAQHFAGMSLEDAVRKAEKEFDSPYHR